MECVQDLAPPVRTNPLLTLVIPVFIISVCLLFPDTAALAHKLTMTDQPESAPDHHRARRSIPGISLSSDLLKFAADHEEAFDLHLGGALQVDYRYYRESCRADNRFDIRKASLSLDGLLSPPLHYRIEWEFQGNDPKNLVEAYGEWEMHRLLVCRIGQFKEPYSLEGQTQDKALFFAERSMGYSYTPDRDVGLMLCGSSSPEIIACYGAGIFNGDGKDGSAWGSRRDQPEVAVRLVLAPLCMIHWPWLKSFQFGGSLSQAQIDLSNVNLDVKSSGMVGTNRSLFVLNQNTKFGVLQNVKERDRWAFEAAWAIGPVALMGEYLGLKYKGLQPAGKPGRKAVFSSWYASVLIFLTEEFPRFQSGVLQPVKFTENPAANLRDKHNRSAAADDGGLVLAIRTDHFSGDKEWIKEDAFVSAREADAISVAVNWIIDPLYRLTVDYTGTDFSDPIRVRVNPDGEVDYIRDEYVLTTRFTIAF
ncbi:MAG: porin [bacterium]